MSATDKDSLTDLIRRLEHRLEQEKRARVEAEALGELGMRELYERQQILGLLEAIATASNGDQPLEGTLRFALSRICEFMGWAVGHVYWVARDQDRLYSSGIWHGMEGEPREDFRRATGEPLTPLRVLSFAFIWGGVGLYMVNAWLSSRRSARYFQPKG